jgi:hypothetical protein
MIILNDTFNKVVISRHKTILAAVKAKYRHNRMIKRYNGQSSYVWYSIVDSEGADISEEVLVCEANYDTERYYRNR